jgi:phosphoribosylpyrophosphate synthetase
VTVIGTNTIPCKPDDNVHVLDVSDITANIVKTRITGKSLTNYLEELSTPDNLTMVMS